MHWRLIALCLSLGTLPAAVAAASTRELAWNYGATTYSEGDVEIQNWFTRRQWTGGLDAAGDAYWQLQNTATWTLGTIVSPADGWEVAAFGGVSQPPALDTSPKTTWLDDVSLQVRHKLTPERSEGRPFDVLAMVEVGVPLIPSLPRGYLLRGLVAWEADLFEKRLKLVANVAFQSTFDLESAYFRVDVTAGIMLRLLPSLLIGIETFWQVPVASDIPMGTLKGDAQTAAYVGPTVTLQVGRLWAALSATMGADKGPGLGLFQQVPVDAQKSGTTKFLTTFNGFAGRLLVGVNF
jgi:hypothetical protein